MSDLRHTDPDLVTDAKITATPQSRSVTGYGPKIPTRYMLRYANTWHRVYMMRYGNAGTAFIVKAGDDLILDLDTRYLLEALAQGGTSTPPEES